MDHHTPEYPAPVVLCGGEGVTDIDVRIGPFPLGAQAASAAAVMAAAFDLTGPERDQREEIFRSHAYRAGLISRGASADGRLVGFCYGFPARDGSWWEAQIRPHLVAVGAGGWLSPQTFELTELHVHPDYQGRGLGRALITEVCDASDLPRVLLSVRAGSAVAHRLYRRLGFVDLAPPFQFNGVPPAYLLMGATQPLAR